MQSSVSRWVGGAVVVGLLACAGAGAVVLARTGGGFRLDATAAEVVRGARLHESARLETEEFAAEMLRKECERGRGVGCGAINTPAPPRAGQQTLVQIRGPLPSTEADAAAPSFGARNLLNNAGPTTPGWRSASAVLPAEIALELAFETQVNRVAFRQTQASPPHSWAKDVELVLARAPDDPGQSAGRWTLRQTTEPQHFSFATRQAKVARIRILSRHGAPGDADYTALGAFALGAATGDPGPLLSG